MFTLEDSALEAVRAHAGSESPRESCGLVVVHKGKQVYLPCTNIHHEPNNNFMIRPEDVVSAEDSGDVVAVVHSHVAHPPVPSDADLVQIEAHGLPWVIVNHPVGNIGIFEPSGYKAPLVGRQFSHGVLDCYSLVRDFYREELGVELPDHQRDPFWWEKGQNIYMDRYEADGWSPVPAEQARRGDMILMAHNSTVPNHAAVYLGDGIMLHHLMGRLSTREVYGGYWAKITRVILRHRSQL
jgi:proteasome lid subunit RPN8/RPN11